MLFSLARALKPSRFLAMRAKQFNENQGNLAKLLKARSLHKGNLRQLWKSGAIPCGKYSLWRINCGLRATLDYPRGAKA
ncbi:hypothetical protein [Comamonas endophytica]|uniref:Uncharacterized protein n=1 Tax=Comamonas endophytica TaxID=2949090 RepID=A0ABY6GFU6_9BURK|nr:MULTISPECIES: hypothetical protein [unclassified Acidovorax]MCD2514648.1 hypothetical protein [Acidovorax sp. D4N7]UYG53960.1 hypothetical protein M9799_20355 [Acidovorax sp. 5MLIR]UYG53999.1 hypothetical protein M9799_19915 [Acidovorax sp. 5MLIR]